MSAQSVQMGYNSIRNGIEAKEVHQKEMIEFLQVQRSKHNSGLSPNTYVIKITEELDQQQTVTTFDESILQYQKPIREEAIPELPSDQIIHRCILQGLFLSDISQIVRQPIKHISNSIQGTKFSQEQAQALISRLNVELSPYECPITGDIFKEPVIFQDGFNYERVSIERWLTGSSKSPVTGQNFLNTQTIRNTTLLSQLRSYASQRVLDLIPYMTAFYYHDLKDSLNTLICIIYRLLTCLKKKLYQPIYEQVISALIQNQGLAEMFFGKASLKCRNSLVKVAKKISFEVGEQIGQIFMKTFKRIQRPRRMMRKEDPEILQRKLIIIRERYREQYLM